MNTYLPVGILLILLVLGCMRTSKSGQVIKPPVAHIIPHELEKHGDVRIDNYYWLRERENPDVIEYLEAENKYTDSLMAHTEHFQDILFEEIKARIKQTDMSVPYKQDDYYYYTRFEEGKEYPLYCRKKGSPDGAEEILLDVNRMAEGFDFFSVGQREVSFNQDLLAYTVDTSGRRIYTLYVKNLTTGEVLEDAVPDVTSNLAWANDNKTLFYTRQDPETLRWDRIYRHELGSGSSQDRLVYEEADSTFSCYVFKTKSKKFLMIGSDQTLSSEYRYLDAHNPNGEFSVFWPREAEHEYSVDHFGDSFYIRTNVNAKNFKLMKTPVTDTNKAKWEDIIPHRDDIFLEGFEIFKDFLVLEERKEGLAQLRVKSWKDNRDFYIDFGEPAYFASIGTNYDFDTPVLRYVYTSLTTPESIFDYNMESHEKVLLKQEEVLGDFNTDNYLTERLWATAHDNTQIPVSLVYRKELKRNDGNPLLLHSYGSYGNSMNVYFDSERLSLLDRGFVYAIAHIRGGQELGREWYENGKLLNKKNTFTDFIACAEYLIRGKYTIPEKLFAEGGSAGGLLMGAVMNMRPDLFCGIIADVPWVDVVTTMLDETVPLTTGEYDEWGNPNDKEYYDYMLSYSPYDNVEAKKYPNLLVLTSLNDSQVQYWEPAKWVAKLRALKTDDNRLLLRTQMEAGHGGVSGRYKQYKETAFEYAFLFDCLGITK
ncbi:MAG: S9 family peptidase [Candidatus Latescibacteria bacterium]|nr:S9 family peptidase [Candidatus Latescibacterota bacterium]